MDPYIGQMTSFGGNFAPRGWAMCDGQLLSISENTELFSILGTAYGGDGVTTFGLPDLRGRVAIHQGQGPGLSNYAIGMKGGAETVTLTTDQIPSHSHSYMAGPGDNAQLSPENHSLPDPDIETPYATTVPTVQMHAGSVGDTGIGQSHSNIQPFLVLTQIIALEGIFPSRS